MSETKFHACPICSTLVPHWARYPTAICRDCFEKACDDQERKLDFYNVSVSGGFKAVVVETGEENENHICYIEGMKCWADEVRFGGIVIQPYEGLRQTQTTQITLKSPLRRSLAWKNPSQKPGLMINTICKTQLGYREIEESQFLETIS